MALNDSKAKEYKNDDNVELAWAMKAYHHAETYFNLISSVDSSQLKLTKHDDELYKHFRHDFPDMKIDQIKEEELKSDTAKRKWRPFCNHFDGTIDDFNYGTLIRLNCEENYTEENSIFVTRVQFFAIEVARNREGLNLFVWKTTKHKEAPAAGQGSSAATEVQGSSAAMEVQGSGDAEPQEVAAQS